MHIALLLTSVFSLLAADVTIRIDRPTTNVTIITITLPEATQVQVQTNVVPSAVRTWTVPPDARASLPRAIPTPPMPPPWVPPGFIKDWDRGDPKEYLESLKKHGPGGVPPPKVRWKKIDAPWLTSLPDGTNSYSEHVELWNKDKAERGLRRGE